MTLSSKILSLKPSITLALNEKTRTLKASGVDVIAFSSGESCLRPPQSAKDAAHQAVDGLSFYTATEGTLELRNSISDYLWRHNNLRYNPREIIASTGCKQSLFNLLFVLLNPGDEVLIPAPYWTSYPEMVAACDGQAVIVPTAEDARYLPTPEVLKDYITPKTKLLILNSPSNPSSQVFRKNELQALADLLIHFPHIWICCDDIYDKLYVTQERPWHLLEVAPELKERTIIVSGLSKSHAMSGWRLGFAAGPQALIAAMTKLQSQSTTHPCVIAQAAATAALNGADNDLEEARNFYRSRHDFFQQQLVTLLPHLKALPAEGGFYQWLDLREILRKGGWKTDTEFAQDLLESEHVSVVPGSAFGQAGFMRLSVTESEPRLGEGLQRLKRFLEKRKAL